EQIARGSVLEHDVLRTLAIEREPVSLGGLLVSLGPRAGRGAVLDALEGLRRRSLVERVETDRTAAFTLQPVVLEYVTSALVETVTEEVVRGKPAQVMASPLIKAQARDHVRLTQERVIGAPILQLLNTQLGERGTRERLSALLDSWRDQPADEQSY